MRKSPAVVRMPDQKLARFISHYWLSVSNPFPAQRILPDGRVDLVIESTGSAAQSWIYGTTTRPATVPITRGFHYLGIQFKPGQSRHFVTLPAQELTDSHAPALVFSFCVQSWPKAMALISVSQPSTSKLWTSPRNNSRIFDHRPTRSFAFQ